MTDARLRGEWLTAPAHDGLTDAAYRILHNALMHSNEQGTDGAVTTRELRFLYPGTIEPAWLAELEAAGFWEPTPAGYQLIGWTGALGQSAAADVEAYRAGNRERQRRHRERQRDAMTQPGGGSDAPAASQTVSGPRAMRDEPSEVTRYIPREVGKARTGQAREVSQLPENKGGEGRARENATARTCPRHPLGWDHDEPCRTCGEHRKAEQTDREHAEQERAAAAAAAPPSLSRLTPSERAAVDSALRGFGTVPARLRPALEEARRDRELQAVGQ